MQDKKDSPFKKKFNRIVKDTKYALRKVLAIRKEIRLTFLTAAISIFILELFLKRYPAPYQTIFIAGDIYLRVCYSIIAATIFWFINQHIPKEDRKLRSFTFINNKLISISGEVTNLLERINIPLDKKLTKEALTAACIKINPKTKVYNFYETDMVFNDWYEYLDYKRLKIKGLISDLLILNESLDSNLMEELLLLENIAGGLHVRNKNIVNEDLSTWALHIFLVTESRNRLINILMEKYRPLWSEHSDKRRLKEEKKIKKEKNKKV